MALRRLKLGRGLEIACLDVGPLSPEWARRHGLDGGGRSARGSSSSSSSVAGATAAEDAPPLVLLHGIGADRGQWILTLPAFARRRRVLAFDLLGHGRSGKPTGPGVAYRVRLLADSIVEAIEALPAPPARVDLLGHSLGGAVALDIVRRFPRLVDRLVLVDSAGLPPGVALSLHAMSLPFVPNSFAESQRLLKTSVNAKLLNNPLVAAAASAYKRRKGNRQQLMSLVSAMACGEDVVTPRDLARIRHETLVLWGDGDRIFPLATGRRLCEALPNARLEILPRCGHVPPTERPVAFARRVEAFLKRVERAAPHPPARPSAG